MQNGTVRDLELRLLDPRGPLQNHFCSPVLNFYTATEASKELDPRMQVSQLSEELYIHESAAGIWLKKWPDTGKFLEAMYYSRFHPRSPNFQITWTAKTFPKLSPREALILVREMLNGSATHAESECRFIQIFGKLTAKMESWNMFNLALCQHFDGPLRRFKQVICQHYVDLARFVATSMVSTDQALPPIMPHWGRGCNILGHDWPWPITDDRAMQNQLNFGCDVRPGLAWQPIARVLRFWEWDFPTEEFAAEAHTWDVDEEPEEFHTLQPDERLQMVHVQLRLSCCNVADVRGPLNEVGAGCMHPQDLGLVPKCPIMYLFFAHIIAMNAWWTRCLGYRYTRKWLQAITVQGPLFTLSWR
eukprot:Skav224190  [mRNA]  locus=scaffold5107:2:1081:- [translate_table: standard]